MIAWLGREWHKRRGLGLDVVPAVVALGLMFWFGLTPIESLPGPQFKLVDKVWHLVAFGGLAGLLSRAVAHFGRPTLVAARDAGAVAVALGGLIEGLQATTAYRSADWGDFIADTLGALLAYGVLRGLASAAARSAV